MSIKVPGGLAGLAAIGAGLFYLANKKAKSPQLPPAAGAGPVTGAPPNVGGAGGAISGNRGRGGRGIRTGRTG